MILGHAEGGTSTIYIKVAEALRRHDYKRLRQVGEILNHHRFKKLYGYKHHRPADQADAYERAVEILDARRVGQVVKDVIQFAIVERYVDEHPDAFHLIIVDRDPADVVATRLRRGRNKPCEPVAIDPWRRRGRLLALADRVPGARVVGFPDALTDDAVLFDALASFGVDPSPIAIGGAKFAGDVARRAKTLARAKKLFAEQIENTRQAAELPDPPTA